MTSDKEDIRGIREMIKQSNDVGSSSKPPLFTADMDYAYWRDRFEQYVNFHCPELWGPLNERYVAPVAEGNYRGIPPARTYKAMTPEERKEYDIERKAHSAICMCLTKDVLRLFKTHDITYDLWKAIETRCGGNEKYKEAKLELIKKQYDLFDILPNETASGLFTRYSQLVSELTEGGYIFPLLEVNKKLLDVLPSAWDVKVQLLKESQELPNMSLDNLIGVLQAHAMELKKKECKSGGFVQDPTLYGGKVNAGKSYGGMAFISNTNSSSNHTGGTHSVYVSGGSQQQQTSVSPAIEEQAAIYAAFLSSYKDLVSQPNTTLQMVQEDYAQLDDDDLEQMDLNWNIAMISRRVKKFLQRTGRKNLDGEGKKGFGFDKSKVRCYNCQNLGHFARECEKPKMPPSGLTTPSSSPKAKEKEIVKDGSADNALIVFEPTNLDWSAQAS